MPTRLIVNADDFGFSRGVTDGILRCHAQGILTSTTLMTTMPDGDRALGLAREHPSLGVGVHLSLTQGKPRSRCRRLAGRDGEFVRSLPRIWLKLRSRAARQEARDELIAQIEYARSHGLSPTHVDSHKHVCHIPALHEPFIAACKATGIGWVRTAREAAIPDMPRMSLSYRRLNAYAGLLAQRVRAAGLQTTDWFFGLATTGRTNAEIWRRLFANPPAGLGEVMVHPGFLRDLPAGETRLIQERVTEMDALCDPSVRQNAQAAGIILTRFTDAPPSP